MKITHYFEQLIDQESEIEHLININKPNLNLADFGHRLISICRSPGRSMLLKK